MDRLLSDDIEAAIDAHATNLVNDNYPEGAWFLRGATDALRGLPSEGPRVGLYAKFYNAGYNSVAAARAAVEV